MLERAREEVIVFLVVGDALCETMFFHVFSLRVRTDFIPILSSNFSPHFFLAIAAKI